jgi:5'(3')-deoxyribonucleotidase
MKNLVVIDVDNVLADSIRTWCKLVKERLAVDIKFENITSHKLVGCVPFTPAQIFDLQDNVWGNWPQLPTTEEGIPHILEQLQGMDYRINLATSGPVRHVRYVRKWLARNRIPYDKFENVKNKSNLSADILVDDAPEEIRAFASTKRSAFLYDRPWNRALANGRFLRITKLSQLIQHLHQPSNQTRLLAATQVR